MSLNKFAIDFDSLNTNIYKVGSGLILSEPTVSAVVEGSKPEIKAVGDDAKKLIGKTAKNTKIVFPVFEGEIVNEIVSSAVLKEFMAKVGGKKLFASSEVLFSLPCGYPPELIDKYLNVAKACGFSKVYFAESPVLAVLGLQVSLNDSNPCFIIDMAGGVTNIAAVSLDGVIVGVSVNYGENKVYADIIDYIAEKYGLQIGLLSAERLKKEISSLEDGDLLPTIVNGRDIETGAPKSLSIRAADIAQPIFKYYDKIFELAGAVLKKLPAEVSAEIRHAGIYLSGVGSLTYGLQAYYEQKFSLPIKICENSEYAVAIGGGVAMGNRSLLKKIAIDND